MHENKTRLPWPIKQNNDFIDHTGVVYAELNDCDRLGRVRSVTKSTHEYDMIDHIGAVYAKKEYELLWPNG